MPNHLSRCWEADIGGPRVCPWQVQRAQPVSGQLGEDLLDVYGEIDDQHLGAIDVRPDRAT